MGRRAADAVTLEKQAFDKTTPRCQHFGVCGGCTLQDLPYPSQLELKRTLLSKQFAAMGYTEAIPVQGLDEPWRYRNKMEFTFGMRDGEVVLGLHERSSFWKIVDVLDCHLVPAVFNDVLAAVRQLVRATTLPVYHPRTHVGFFRYLILRQSRATQAVVACLITAPGDEAVIESLTTQLRQAVPQIRSVYWGVNQKMADVAIPDALRLMAGEAYFEEAEVDSVQSAIRALDAQVDQIPEVRVG